MYTHLEDYINDLYKLLKIKEPKDLTIENVSKNLGLIVLHEEKAFRYSNEIFIEPSTEQREWLQFSHEICHFLRHAGLQVAMHPLFLELQEYQAAHFSYHFCVPTFMLENLKEVTVYDIINLFNVDEAFAIRRLEMYQSKQLLIQLREKYV